MNQIAIGDGTSAGSWLVLSGEGVAVPFKQVRYLPVFSTEPDVQETLEINLEGTPAELAEGIANLENIRQRIALYQNGGHPAPQCLRFRMTQGSEYDYALLTGLEIEVNPDAPETHLTGSLRVVLHLTRPNHYDSELLELPLTSHDVEDVLGGVDLFNHTDGGHSNSVLVKPGDIDSDLPASLRLELTNTTENGEMGDIYLGIFHHPEEPDEEMFFCYGGDFVGGSLFNSAEAINETYIRVAWAGTDWALLGSWALHNTTVQHLAGISFRPILRFYDPHTYQDLLLKIKLQAGSNVLWEGESVYVDSAFGYVLFPPVRIPPTKLLNEGLPHHVDLVLYGQHDTAVIYTLDFDCLTLLPLSPGANFLAFYNLYEDARLIDDNFLGMQVSDFSQIGSETVAHVRQGGVLTLHPGHYNRLVVVMADGDRAIDIFRTARLQLFYRKRRRVL
jgi:hypothetical protein